MHIPTRQTYQTPTTKLNVLYCAIEQQFENKLFNSLCRAGIYKSVSIVFRRTTSQLRAKFWHWIKSDAKNLENGRPEKSAVLS